MDERRIKNMRRNIRVIAIITAAAAAVTVDIITVKAICRKRKDTAEEVNDNECGIEYAEK